MAMVSMPSSSKAARSSGVAWPRMPRVRLFAVVHAARFFGKAVAHVFGVGQHVAHGLQPGGLQVGGLRPRG
jgi:hypothetical protein